MGAGDADERLAGRRGGVGHDLLPGFERDAVLPGGGQLRVVRRDRRQRLGDGEAIDDRPVGVRDVGGIVRGHDRDAARLEGGGVGGRRTGIAGADVGPDAGREQGSSRGAGTGCPDDVDAFPPADGARRPGRSQAGPDLGRAAGHASRLGSRRSTRSSAAPALASLLPCRSPVHRKRWTSWPAASATAT